MSILDQAGRLLAEKALCDACLGRQFARLSHGLSNAERGRALRVALGLARDEPLSPPELCELCINYFERAADWAQRGITALAGFEFERYLVGTKPPGFLVEAEAALRAELAIETGEPWKQAYNRAVGRHFDALAQEALGRPVRVDFRDPEVLLTVDLVWERVSVQVHPLYVFGRYRKLARGLPQTHWPCRRCRGRGCASCGGTGAQYPESVESLLGEPLRALCEGEGVTLHGAGREDIDALMLGSGRPFVLEVKRPRKRALDWDEAATAVNAAAAGKVEVAGLQPVTGGAVGRVKEAEARKRYRARVAFDAPVGAEAFQAALEALVGRVEQRTPQRVAHRRADLVREREVFEIRGELLAPQRAEVTLEGAGGLYVKELISGDAGRTTPSLAGLLGVDARVTELDVLDVIGTFL